MNDFNEFNENLLKIATYSKILENHSLMAEINAKLEQQNEKIIEEGGEPIELITSDTPINLYPSFIKKIEGPSTLDLTADENHHVYEPPSGKYYKSVSVNISQEGDLGVIPYEINANGHYEAGQDVGWNPLTVNVITVDEMEINISGIEIPFKKLERKDLEIGNLGIPVTVKNSLRDIMIPLVDWNGCQSTD